MKLNDKKLYCYEDSNIELISNLQITIHQVDSKIKIL